MLLFNKFVQMLSLVDFVVFAANTLLIHNVCQRNETRVILTIYYKCII